MPFHVSQSNLRAHCGAELRKRKKKKNHSPPGSSEDYPFSLPHPPSSFLAPPPRPGLALAFSPGSLAFPQRPGSAARRRAAIPSREKTHSPPPPPPLSGEESQKEPRGKTTSRQRLILRIVPLSLCEQESFVRKKKALTAISKDS